MVGKGGASDNKVHLIQSLCKSSVVDSCLIYEKLEEKIVEQLKVWVKLQIKTKLN